MRRLVGVLAVVVCVSGAVAAGSGLLSRTGLSVSAHRALKAGLSPAARQSLAGAITPAQQLKMLQASPAMQARLQQLGPAMTVKQLQNTEWQDGITLTPLAATYPAGGDYMNFNLALNTRAAYISQLTPLPTAEQEPPVLWLNVAGNNDPLLWIEAKWPEPGGYLVTFFLKDLWPNSTAKPRIRVNGAMTTVVSNTPTGADRWTILCTADDPQDLYDEIAVYPVESGFGLTMCCLSKVVVSKFWIE